MIKDRTGETNIHKNGLKMTIVAYRGVNDIDVLFENGHLVEHTYYQLFKLGTIQNNRKKHFIGEILTNSNGDKFTIIGYGNNNLFNIKYEDGTIKENANIYREQRNKAIHFKSKKRPSGIKGYDINTKQDNKKYYEGKAYTDTHGEHFKIINYQDYDHVTILFDDGTEKIVKLDNIFKNTVSKYGRRTSGRRTNGRRTNGRRTDNSINYLNKTTICNNGLECEIIEYNNCDNIKVKFETNYIKRTRVSKFNIGSIGHPFPYQINNIVIDKPISKHNTNRIFNCYCVNCNYNQITTLDDAKNHICGVK